MRQRRFLERKIERKDKGNYLGDKICPLWSLILSLILFHSSPKSARIARWSSAGLISGINKWAEMMTSALSLQTSPSCIPVVESSLHKRMCSGFLSCCENVGTPLNSIGMKLIYCSISTNQKADFYWKCPKALCAGPAKYLPTLRLKMPWVPLLIRSDV